MQRDRIVHGQEEECRGDSTNGTVADGRTESRTSAATAAANVVPELAHDQTFPSSSALRRSTARLYVARCTTPWTTAPSTASQIPRARIRAELCGRPGPARSPGHTRFAVRAARDEVALADVPMCAANTGRRARQPMGARTGGARLSFAAEGWQSGRMRRSRKPFGVQAPREFESPPLRLYLSRNPLRMRVFRVSEGGHSYPFVLRSRPPERGAHWRATGAHETLMSLTTAFEWRALARSTKLIETVGGGSIVAKALKRRDAERAKIEIDQRVAAGAWREPTPHASQGSASTDR